MPGALVMMTEAAVEPLAQARQALLAFRTSDPDQLRALLDYAGVHVFSKRAGLPRRYVADALEQAICLGWVEPKFDRGFVLTQLGRDELRQQEHQPSG
jgi:hypothetical protein